ncbi:MAG TPA: hypothetical protein VIY28_07685 [Pseudonocardiaceae bacterium]
MPSSRRRSAAVVLLALGLALAGCGSSKPAAAKDSDPTAWAGAFCTGISDEVAAALAFTKAQPTAQSQKDAVLAFVDGSQQAFASTAHRLDALGPPRIADGKRVQDTAVSYFSNTAGTLAGQRPKLAALDPNAPDFVMQLSKLGGPDLTATSAQAHDLVSNPELMPAFRASPECQKLGTAAAPR